MKKVGDDRVRGLTNIAIILWTVVAVTFVVVLGISIVVLARLPEILKVLLS